MEEETDLFEPLWLSYYCIFYSLKMLKHCPFFSFKYVVIDGYEFQSVWSSAERL